MFFLVCVFWCWPPPPKKKQRTTTSPGLERAAEDDGLVFGRLMNHAAQSEKRVRPQGGFSCEKFFTVVGGCENGQPGTHKTGVE